MGQILRCSAALAAGLGSALFGTPASAAEFATVISATPVSASVPVSRQECSDSRALVQQPPSGAGALLGAIAGGVIGHNLGSGAGRAAATGIGAVTGSVIGNQVEADATPPADVPVRRCRTVTRLENRNVGYDVMYEYAGQRYSTRMARDPGPTLEVSVRPAEANGASVPAPLYAEAAPAEPVPPATTYYESQPRNYYYAPVPPAVYVAPAIGFGFGFGYYGGWRGGHRRW